MLVAAALVAQAMIDGPLWAWLAVAAIVLFWLVANAPPSRRD
jgi:hypothetical protein